MLNNLLARVALLMFALVPALATAIEEPAYELVASWDDSGVEIRYYEPKVLATTKMAAGESSGFRVLAGYIFGGNAAEQEIAMTAPVQRTMPANNGARWPSSCPPSSRLKTCRNPMTSASDSSRSRPTTPP